MVAAGDAGRRRVAAMSDEIWEHKKGRIWLLVRRLELENRVLRRQVRILQARLARAARAAS